MSISQNMISYVYWNKFKGLENILDSNVFKQSKIQDLEDVICQVSSRIMSGTCNNYEFIGLNHLLNLKDMRGVFCNHLLSSVVKEIIASKFNQPLLNTLPDEITLNIFDYFTPHFSNSNPNIINPSPLFPTRDLKALACVSKRINLEVNAKFFSFMIELNLQKEEAEIVANYQIAEEAVEYIIEKNLQIANLRHLSDLTNEILEKLFDNCSNLKHLIISSSRITKLPSNCNNLESLGIYYSPNLTSLPDCLTQLTLLTCRGSALTFLPDCLTQLTILDCSGSYALNSLPNCLTQLRDLNISSCPNLASVPVSLPQLTSLDCSGNHALTSLPTGLTQLRNLNISRCPNLASLPIDLTELETCKISSDSQINYFPLRQSQCRIEKEPECNCQLF